MCNHMQSRSVRKPASKRALVAAKGACRGVARVKIWAVSCIQGAGRVTSPQAFLVSLRPLGTVQFQTAEAESNGAGQAGSRGLG